MEGSHPEEPLDTINTTNVKLYVNKGKGFFKDATNKILMKMRAPRETYLTTQCDELVSSKLSHLLSVLAVSHKRGDSENTLRQHFRRIIFWLGESAYTYGRMLFSGDDVLTPTKYRYYTIPTPIIDGRDHLTVLGTLLSGNVMHVTVAYGQNNQPTVANHVNESKARVGSPANLTLNLHGNAFVTLGVFCYDKVKGCEFDLMYMLHYIDEPMDGKASSACESLGNVMEKGWDLGTFYAFGCEIMFSVNNV